MNAIVSHILYMFEKVLADDIRELSIEDQYEVLQVLKGDLESTMTRLPPPRPKCSEPPLPLGHRQPPG